MKDMEIEAKLAIRSGDPASVMAAIAGLDAVEGFRFLTLPTVRIRDSYLELPGGGRAAGGQRLALRRREVDDRALLTLKGEADGPAESVAPGAANRTEQGVSRRLEIEVPEGEAGWRRIRDALGDAGVRVGEWPDGLHALRPFQLRETERLRRAVVPVGTGGGAGDPESRTVPGAGDELHPRDSVAELALDTVTLDVSGRRVRFREVEVEARPGMADPQRLVSDVGNALRTAISAERLRPWSLSKLATGMALVELAGNGGLDGVIDENGNLLPQGLDRIAGVQG